MSKKEPENVQIHSKSLKKGFCNERVAKKRPLLKINVAPPIKLKGETSKERKQNSFRTKAGSFLCKTLQNGIWDGQT